MPVFSHNPLATRGTVYLIHLDPPYRHARHYLGWTTNLNARLARHVGEGEKDGRGSRLVEVAVAAGSRVVVARTWAGSRRDERRIKGRGLSEYCPMCCDKPRMPVGVEETYRMDKILKWKKRDVGSYEAKHLGSTWWIAGKWNESGSRIGSWDLMRDNGLVDDHFGTLRDAKQSANEIIAREAKPKRCSNCPDMIDTKGAPFGAKNGLCPACWRDFRGLVMYAEDRAAEKREQSCENCGSEDVSHITKGDAEGNEVIECGDCGHEEAVEA